MNWATEANNLYREILESVVANAPFGFKGLIRLKARKYESEIRRQIEKKAEERGSQLVEKEDIVAAIVEWTPPEKKKFVIKVLKDSGVDVNKYFKKTDIFQALY